MTDTVASARRFNWPLLAFLAVAIFLAYEVFQYFLLTFTIAGSVALLMNPLQGRLTRRMGNRAGLAAALLVLLTVVVILIPVLSYGTIIARQASVVTTWAGPRLDPEYLDQAIRKLTLRFPLLAPILASEDSAGGSVISRVVAGAASTAQKVAQALLTGVATATVDVLLFLMMLFFLLRDGGLLREQLRGVSPFTRTQEQELLDHLTRTVKGVLLAILVVPIVQGMLAFVGFLIFGVPAPLLWAFMVVFAAMIPIIGSPLGWVPAGLYLIGTDRNGAGIGMLLYGALVISTSDNIVKPLIMKNAANIHTLLAFLSILGGVQAFGPKGVIAGPVVLSLVLSAYRIYRYDILRWRQAHGLGNQGEEDEPASDPSFLRPENTL
jgi:predicted PurR-regulated permease PerM